MEHADSSEVSRAGAIEIVRRLISKGLDDTLFPVFEVVETPDEYRIYVTYGTQRDKYGNVTGFIAGGHAVYVLGRNGQILRIVEGA